MLRIKGLDQLQRQLQEAQNALQEIDGEIGIVSFEPNDPGSIEAAINTINKLIDERIGNYSSNPFISPIIDGMKRQYRESILEKAAAERLKGGA